MILLGLFGCVAAAMASGSPGLAVVRDATNGQQWLYNTGSDGQIWTWWYDGSSWTGNESLGNGLGDGAPAAAGSANAVTRDDPSNQEWVFYIGSNGQVYEWWYNGATWAYNGALGNGEAAAAGSPIGAVRDTSSSNGDQWVYYTGSDGHIWRWWWNGSTWVNQALGGEAAAAGSGLAVTRDQSSGEQWVFYTGSAAQIWTWWYNGSTWANQALGNGEPAATGSTIAAVVDLANSYGQQWVYYTGSDGHIWTWWLNSRTWANATLGGEPTAAGSGIAVTRDDPSNQEWVFYTGSNGQVYLWWYSGSWAYNGALGNGEAVEADSTIAAVRDPSSSNGDQWVYYTGSNGQTWTWWWNGSSWTGNDPLGTYFWAYPGCSGLTDCWTTDTSPSVGPFGSTEQYNDTGVANFVPSGDCTHDNKTCNQPGESNGACNLEAACPYGGASNSSSLPQAGTWCVPYTSPTDENPPLTTDCVVGAHISGQGPGATWYLHTGYDASTGTEKDECPGGSSWCGDHLLILPTPSNVPDSDYPWSSSLTGVSSPVLHFGAWEDITADDAGPAANQSGWHAFWCVDLGNPPGYGNNYLEDCAQTWRSAGASNPEQPTPTMGCTPSVVAWTGLGDKSDRYMTTVAAPDGEESQGNQLNDPQAYIATISVSQLMNALSDANSKCGASWNPSEPDQVIALAFYAGAEGQGNGSDSTANLSWNVSLLPAYTSY